LTPLPTGLGVLFTVASVLLSAVGSLTASRNRTGGLPFWPALGWGMVYGAAASALIAASPGPQLRVAAGVLVVDVTAVPRARGLGAHFRLLPHVARPHRPGPSGAIGVMTPLLALVVSMLFESYRPDVLTGVGAALAVAGNALMLRRPA